MAIVVACPACGKSYQVSDQFAGRKFRCKGCDAAVAVPNLEPAFDPFGLADTAPSNASTHRRVQHDGDGLLGKPLVAVAPAKPSLIPLADPDENPMRGVPALRRKRDRPSDDEAIPFLGMPDHIAPWALFGVLFLIDALPILARAGLSSVVLFLLLIRWIISIVAAFLNAGVLIFGCSICGQEVPGIRRGLSITLLIAIVGSILGLLIGVLPLSPLSAVMTWIILYTISSGIILSRMLDLTCMSLLALWFVQFVLFCVLILTLNSLAHQFR